jgi:predicted nuclease of restriction endonuclease-like (RecB) superfamily
MVASVPVPVRRKRTAISVAEPGFDAALADVIALLEAARHLAARAVNAAMTAAYWSIGRRIVEQEQRGRARAEYGEELVDHLAADLTKRFGRGFGRRNLFQMKAFYLAYPQIVQTASAQSRARAAPGKVQTLSALSRVENQLAERAFPLPWSHYVRLLAVRDEAARGFYETEALRGGWTVRQLDRQIETMFYERTALSRNKVAMLTKGARPRAEDAITPEEEIKDPLVLEFLGLKDEYSEAEIEEALIVHLEQFILELGGDFTFVGRQRRLRIGDAWYRIDLIFFHRALRCLVVIDLKLGSLTHADAGQMHLYLNYAREHWTRRDENPPVGLILCAKRDAAVAKYALEGLSNKVLAAEYRTALPEEKVLEHELKRSRQQLEARGAMKRAPRGAPPRRR